MFSAIAALSAASQSPAFTRSTATSNASRHSCALSHTAMLPSPFSVSNTSSKYLLLYFKPTLYSCPTSLYTSTGFCFACSPPSKYCLFASSCATTFARAFSTVSPIFAPRTGILFTHVNLRVVAPVAFACVPLCSPPSFRLSVSINNSQATCTITCCLHHINILFAAMNELENRRRKASGSKCSTCAFAPISDTKLSSWRWVGESAVDRVVYVTLKVGD
jgi:hypothetical protein